jgi:hypothetical protein
MLHADASPKPSPEGCTTNELRQEPPPVKPPVKKTAARCLHELQDPSSPPKPRKLYRTESTYGAPIPSLSLGVAQFTAERKQVDEVMQNMLDQKMVIDPDEQILTQGEDESVAADAANEPVAEPVAETVAEPVAEPVAADVVTSDKEPVTGPVTADKEPVAGPVTADAANEPVAEPVAADF